jgi:hypothetical protein
VFVPSLSSVLDRILWIRTPSDDISVAPFVGEKFSYHTDGDVYLYVYLRGKDESTRYVYAYLRENDDSHETSTRRFISRHYFICMWHTFKSWTQQ